MGFSEEIVEAVWEKGRGMAGRDTTRWRKDECGAWIQRDQYGNPASEFGWKIDNVLPGGDDTVDNLRPFHHRNAFDRSTGKAICRVTADRQGVAGDAHIGNPANREN